MPPAPANGVPTADLPSSRAGDDRRAARRRRRWSAPGPGRAVRRAAGRSIVPNPRQPRTVFDEDALDELVELDPRGRRPAARRGAARWPTASSSSWVSAAGAPTQAAGLETIPAIVRDTEDGDLLRDALLENLHRSQLNPLEEAAAYQQLLDDFGVHARGAGDADRPVAAADLEHDPPAQAAAARAAPRRGGCAVRRTRARAARSGRRRSDRAPRAADRRRGSLGPCRRGDRRPWGATRSRLPVRPVARRASATRRSTTWRLGSRTGSRPA